MRAACNLTLKRAHLPVTWFIDFIPQLQLAIAIMLFVYTCNMFCFLTVNHRQCAAHKWFSGELFSSLNFGPVTDRRTDRQKAIYMSPQCKSTGLLKKQSQPTDANEIWTGNSGNSTFFFTSGPFKGWFNPLPQYIVMGAKMYYLPK